MKIFLRLLLALASIVLLSGCFHSKLFKSSPAPAPAPAETAAPAPAETPVPAPAASEDAVDSIREKLKAANFQATEYEQALALEAPENAVKSWKFQVQSGNGNIDIGVIVAKDDLSAAIITGELRSQLDEVKKADAEFTGEFFDTGKDEVVVTLSYYLKDVNAADVAKLKQALQ